MTVAEADNDRNAAIADILHPEHHRACIKRHRAEWPMLWRALDKLQRAVENGR